MTANGRHSNLTLAAFAAPCLPMAALGLPLVVHLPNFYTQLLAKQMDETKALSLVGAIFIAVRLLDIGIDPILGGWMDRTRTRLGRFRPWMLASVVLLGLATFMLFMPPGGLVGPVFLTLWLLVVYIGFSIAVLAQTSWAAVLSPDYDQRSRIFGFWTTGNVIGIILVLLLPVIITTQGGTQADGVSAMGWFIVILLPLTIGLAAWRVPEPMPTAGEATHASLKVYLEFLRLPAIRRLMWTDLLFGLAPGITGALALFYFRAAKGMDEGQANILIFLYFAAGLLGATLWTWVATRIGKHRAMALAGVVFAVAYLGVWLAPSGNFPLLAASMVAVGIPFCAGQVLLRAMLADVSDEDRLISGKDRTGMLFALLTATNKVGYALAVGTFFPLSMAGFIQKVGAPQTERALDMLELLLVALPIALLLIASFVIFRFPINKERQAEIRAQLDARA